MFSLLVNERRNRCVLFNSLVVLFLMLSLQVVQAGEQRCRGVFEDMKRATVLVEGVAAQQASNQCVHVAVTRLQQSCGYIDIPKAVIENTGILFAFEEEARRHFVMTCRDADGNTHDCVSAPLDILFFNAEKRLVERATMPIGGSYKTKNAAKYALEVPISRFEHYLLPINDSRLVVTSPLCLDE